MIPITRIETFLAKICGDDVTTPTPITRLEKYWDIIAGNAAPVLLPITRVEFYLAKIAGLDVNIPTPITREEFYLAATAGVAVEIPTPVTRYEYWLAGVYEAIGVAPILKTVTGALIHITDALAKPAHELVAVLKPVQDLHGYDAPWPAGGGKNLLPLTVDYLKSNNTGGTWDGNAFNISGVTFTINVDEAGNVVGITVNGTSSENILFVIGSRDYLTVGTEYTFSGSPTDGSATTYCMRIANPSWTAVVGSRTFTLVESTTARIGVYVASGVTVSNKQFTPMICLSSATNPTTFAPYSNICPISGWSGVNVYGTGINIWDEETEKGYWNVSTGNKVTSGSYLRCSNYIPVKPDTEYSFVSHSGSYQRTILFLDSEKKPISFVSANDVRKFTTPNNCCFVVFYFNSGYGSTYENDVSINYPSTDTSYHAYHGQTLPINWEDEAGTIYGGTVTLNEDGSADVVKAVEYGQATADYLASFSSTNCGYLSSMSAFAGSPGVWFRNLFYSAGAADRRAGGIFSLCNAFPIRFNDTAVSSSQNRAAFQVDRASITSVETFIATVRTLEANGSGLFIAYELATPQTYHFDNIGQLLLFAGENNIWVDASDDLTLTYYADGNVSDEEALNTLLGGMYSPGGDVSDKDALNILLGN